MGLWVQNEVKKENGKRDSNNEDIFNLEDIRYIFFL